MQSKVWFPIFLENLLLFMKYKSGQSLAPKGSSRVVQGVGGRKNPGPGGTSSHKVTSHGALESSLLV